MISASTSSIVVLGHVLIEVVINLLCQDLLSSCRIFVRCSCSIGSSTLTVNASLNLNFQPSVRLTISECPFSLASSVCTHVCSSGSILQFQLNLSFRNRQSVLLENNVIVQSRCSSCTVNSAKSICIVNNVDVSLSTDSCDCSTSESF